MNLKIKDISETETNFLSNNIYDYCCLELFNISENEKIQYIINKNNKYNDKIIKEKIDVKKVDYNICTELKSKYLKIIEERLNL